MNAHLERGYTDGYAQQYNDHNQYFHFMNIGGVFALGAFLIALSFGARLAIISRDYLQISFVVSFAIICIVENILVRRAGILYFTFFYCFFFSHARLVTSKQSSDQVNDKQ